MVAMPLTSIAAGSNFQTGLFTAASGLNDATVRMNVVANNVANSNTGGFIPARVHSAAHTGGGVTSGVDGFYLTDPDLQSQTDLITEGINLILAKHAFQANAVSLKTAGETGKSLIDALG